MATLSLAFNHSLLLNIWGGSVFHIKGRSQMSIFADTYDCFSRDKFSVAFWPNYPFRFAPWEEEQAEDPP